MFRLSCSFEASQFAALHYQVTLGISVLCRVLFATRYKCSVVVNLL